MSDEVEVPYGKNPQETAILLLAAAEELGLPPAVVRTNPGVFIVPAEVNAKAFEQEKPAAKKTAAKTTDKPKGN